MAQNGIMVFSKLDLQKEYHQLELEPECRYITVFSTHVGLFQYKRLNFGIASAAELFQNLIRSKIHDIQGAINVSDDILIHACKDDTHDKALRKTLKRLKDNNLTLNGNKCEFKKPQVIFYGHLFQGTGVSIDPNKVKAVQGMSAPATAEEVRSLIGFVTYCSRFIPNFSDVTAPLRNLTKKDTPWHWGIKEETALETIKKHLSDERILAYFDPGKQSVLYVDASPIGVAGILTQLDQQQTVSIVAFTSKALTEVETRYSQTEREALAVVYGCEHFYMYLQGSKFVVVTDHLPLLKLLGNPRAKTSMRIERWNLRLQTFNFMLTFQPGKLNPADYLSRHIAEKSTGNCLSPMTEAFVNMAVHNATPRALKIEEIRLATSQDKALTNVINCLKKGRWVCDSAADEAHRELVKVCAKFPNELSMVDGILLKEHRIILPREFENRALELAHEGHLGLVKTKQLLRGKVWFYRMDRKVEALIRSCIPCIANTPSNYTEPLQMTPLPGKPWQYLAMDFCGPFPNGDYILVIIDEHSRFPIAELVKTTSATNAINVMERIFSMFGLPQSIKSDNGPPFQSRELKEYFQNMGINHRRITPVWPRANGTAERFMRTIEKTIRAAHVNGQSWQKGIQMFLLNYRNSIHSTTGRTPSELLFGRELRTKIPMMAVPQKQHSKLVQMTDARAKSRMKEYSDLRRNARKHDLKVGDKVLVKQNKTNKLSTFYNPQPYEVTSVKGTMVMAKNHHHSVARNSSFFRRIEERPDEGPVSNETEEQPVAVDEEPRITPGHPNTPRYNLRARTMAPRRLVEKC